MDIPLDQPSSLRCDTPRNDRPRGGGPVAGWSGGGGPGDANDQSVRLARCGMPDRRRRGGHACRTREISWASTAHPLSRPAGGSLAWPGDEMRLHGLFTAALADPALDRASELALPEALDSDQVFDADQVDLTAPASLRPFVAAVLAAGPTAAARAGRCSRSPRPPARPRTSPPRWPTCSRPSRSRSTRPGRRCRTSGSRPAATRSAGGWRCCAGWPTPTRRRRPLRVVVAPVRSVLQPQLKGLGDLEPVELRTGDNADLDAVVRRLADIAYARTDLVTKRGEFAVRGGILDVFPPTDEHPLRVEFWGDEIEEIRTFAVADQRTLAKVDRLWAPPCRELLLTDDVRARARALAEEHPELAEMLDKLAEGIPVEGMESLAPALLDGPRLAGAAAGLHAGRHASCCCATRSGSAPARTTSSVPARSSSRRAGPRPPSGARRRSTSAPRRSGPWPRYGRRRPELGQPWWSVGPFGVAERRRDAPTTDEPWREPDAGRAADGEPRQRRGRWRSRPRPCRSTTARPAGSSTTSSAGPATAGGCAGLRGPRPGPAGRRGAARRRPRRAAGRRDVDAAPGPGEILVTTGALDHGFIDEAGRLAVVTGTDISGGRGASTRDMGKMPSRRRNTIDPLELRAGDFVVHEQHGIGRYVEMVQRTVNGADREYLVIEYAASKRGQPGDRLFVPTDSLDQLSRYVGGENPTLHKMGGSDWQKAKARARKAVREIAAAAHPALRRAAALEGPRVRPGHAVAARARGRVPLHGDARPALRDRGGQGRHGEAGPDGPAHLRRRRLRQDRDRGAGGVQGGAGRQAGGGAGADDAAGAAALQHVLRADGPVPRRDPAAVAVPDAEGGRGDAGARSATARPTSSSARTGCCSRRPGSRTSAWSSSTRSSASAWSTRSTSRRCGPRSTC